MDELKFVRMAQFINKRYYSAPDTYKLKMLGVIINNNTKKKTKNILKKTKPIY
jgi:hypothetical protein